jgi:pyrimidine-nucleoside phosphorylase
MVAIGELSGRKVVALLSDMNQPLGNAVGNALEVREALDTLRGNGPEDFREHCLVAAAHMLVIGRKAANLEAARTMAETTLESGRALASFRRLVEAQGGDVRYVDEPDRLPVAPLIETVDTPRAGYLLGINAREVGETSVELGAGRARKEDPIDHAVGIEIHCKVGDQVQVGEPLFTIHANDAAKLAAAKTRLLAAHQWSSEAVQPLPLFYDVIGG